MFLSKKDTPRQFAGMWYAGTLNLFMCYFNLFTYINSGSTMTVVACIFSLIVSIVIFTVIKRRANQMLWDKLTKTSRSGITGEASMGSGV